MISVSHEQHFHPASLLRNRNFALLWGAYAVSAFGDHLSELAVLKTQDALNPDVDITPLNARMTFMFFVPFFVLAPLAGLLADKLPRRSLMVAADLARCVLMLGFVALIASMQQWGTWGPFVPLLLIGLFAALFSPARAALLPTLIRRDQLVRANGLIAGLGIIATMAAAKAGGYLADHYEAVVAFRLDAVTFICSAALLLFMSPPRQHKPVAGDQAGRSTLKAIGAGFSYARHHRHVVELLAIASLVWFCAPVINCVIPAVVRDVYHGSFEEMSNYRALIGIGFIIGAIVITTLGDALRSDTAMTWGLFGIAGGIAIFAASVFLRVDASLRARIGAVGVVIAGIFAVAVMASFNSLLQRTVADRFRGRIFGVKDVCCTGALLFATGLLGVPAWTRVDRWVGYILLAVAALMFLAGAVTLRTRLRRGTHGSRLTAAENLNEFIAKFWWRLQRVGRSTLPRAGPVIVTANHTCSADPLLLSAAASYRPMSFLVAAEFTTWPVVKYFLRLVECIPVKRDGRDTAATKHSIRHLREGKAVGIFIEGRIVCPGEVVEPKDGVAMLALKTGARVIPAHISGVKYRAGVVSGLLARHRARVRFGPPVDLEEFSRAKHGREATRAATRRIYAAIWALAPDGSQPQGGDVVNGEDGGRQETTSE